MLSAQARTEKRGKFSNPIRIRDLVFDEKLDPKQTSPTLFDPSLRAPRFAARWEQLTQSGTRPKKNENFTRWQGGASMRSDEGLCTTCQDLPRTRDCKPRTTTSV